MRMMRMMMMRIMMMETRVNDKHTGQSQIFLKE